MDIKRDEVITFRLTDGTPAGKKIFDFLDKADNRSDMIKYILLHYIENHSE